MYLRWVGFTLPQTDGAKQGGSRAGCSKPFVQKGGKRWLGLLLLRAVAGTMLSAGSGHAQLAPTGGQVVTPESSIEQPGDAGVRAHTNIQIFIPSGAVADPPSPWRTDDGGTTIDHPSQVPGADGSGDTARPQ